MISDDSMSVFRFSLFCLCSIAIWVMPVFAGQDIHLVLLSVGGTNSSREMERHFATELKLSLDDCDVVQSKPFGSGFFTLSEEQQYETIRQDREKYGATVVLWLGVANGSIHSLSLFVVTPNGSLARSVAFESKIETAELALTTRALLEQAFAFGREQTGINSQSSSSTPSKDPSTDAADPVLLENGWRRIPKSGQTSVLEHKQVPEEQPEKQSEEQSKEQPEKQPENEMSAITADRDNKTSLRWALEPLARLTTGLAGYHGPATWVGGGAALSLMIGSNLLFEILFVALAGPMPRYTQNIILGLRLDPELRAGYLWRLKRVLLGPVIGVAVPWSNIEINEEEYIPFTYSWWTFRGSMGLESLFLANKRIAVDVGASIGFNALPRESFVHSEDREEVLKTPLMVFCARVGLLFFIG